MHIFKDNDTAHCTYKGMLFSFNLKVSLLYRHLYYSGWYQKPQG